MTIPPGVTRIGNYAFEGCGSLAGVRFLGNAPALAGENVFDSSTPTVYYVSGKTGWGVSFGGRPTDVWRPVVVAFDAAGGSAAFTNWTYSVGETYGLLPAAAWSGYLFGGWRTGRGGTGKAVTTADTLTKTSAYTLYANWLPIPVLTVVRGTVADAGTNRLTVLPGETRAVVADEPSSGKLFGYWAVSPASSKLGGGFDVSNAVTTVTMPTNSVTLTATYVAIPKLTVTGGGIEGGDNPTYVLPGERRTVFAAEVDGKVFEKWTVTPPAADLGGSFNPRRPTTDVVMPRVDVTLAAGYVTSPGYISVRATGTVDFAEVSGVCWSVDGKTWAPANDGNSYPLKAGTYTVIFKSTDAHWIAPQKQAVKVIASASAGLVAAVAFAPFVSWRLSDDSASGSGTVALSPSSGQVLPGKSVTLTAKPAAGYVFVGWEGLDDAAASRRPVLTVAPSADTVYTAHFRAKGDCETPEIWLNAPTVCMVGVTYSAVIDVNDGALPVTFSAVSLPVGLKIDATAGVISGVPTKAGTFSVTLKAKGVAGSADLQRYTFTVDPLPAWAQGTFNGWAEAEGLDAGGASLSVTAQGGVSGKLVLRGTNYSFAAGSYASRDEDGDFVLVTTAKVGKVVWPLTLSVSTPEITDTTGTVPDTLSRAAGVLSTNGTVSLWRNVWKDAGMAAVATNYTGYYTATLPGGDGYGSGYLAFTVDKAGGVKTAGKLADGTAVSLSGMLTLDEAGRVFAALYAVPSAYRGGGLFGVAEFVKSDAGPTVVRLLESPFLWNSFNPQATGEYGAGFARELGLSGGRYNTLINLRAYYESGLAVGGVELPQLTATVKVTDWNDTSTRKVTQSETDAFGAAGDASPNRVVLGVTPATGTGTGLAAPRADAPVKGAEAGAYAYADTTGDGVNNTSGLTFTFTRPTGLFAGTFKAWYDYESATDLTTDASTWTHTSKSVTFQGTLTPVRESDDAEGRGFFLWADKAGYQGAKDKTVSYGYNASYDFLLLAP